MVFVKIADHCVLEFVGFRVRQIGADNLFVNHRPALDSFDKLSPKKRTYDAGRVCRTPGIDQVSVHTTVFTFADVTDHAVHDDVIHIASP